MDFANFSGRYADTIHLCFWGNLVPAEKFLNLGKWLHGTLIYKMAQYVKEQV